MEVMEVQKQDFDNTDDIQKFYLPCSRGVNWRITRLDPKDENISNREVFFAYTKLNPYSWDNMDEKEKDNYYSEVFRKLYVIYKIEDDFFIDAERKLIQREKE